MELNQYKYMFEAEDSHWWYVGNHENFLNLLYRYNILKDHIKVLDAGCGTGKWLEILKKANIIFETGIDFQEKALEFARSRSEMNLHIGDVNESIFPSSSFDLITSFDVLCNRNINNSAVLKNFYTYLNNKGHLLLTLPAYQFLHSKHDKVVHTGKRYTKKQLRTLLEENGFEIIKITYAVSLLFPVALIKRGIDKVLSNNDSEHNEVKIPSKFINRLFLSVMRFENFLLKYFSFPFGLSVMALARKKE